MTVDELINFIERDDKVSKKKNKKKGADKKKLNQAKESVNSEIKTVNDLEIEMENFKNKLKMDSIHCENIEKKKAFLTREWILSL